MRFTLVGDDRLTPALNRAGRSAGQLDRQLDRVGTGGGRSVNNLVRDSEGRLRTLDGRFAAAGAAAERDLGGGIERGSRRGGRGLGGLLPLIGRLGSMGGSILSIVGPLGKVAATLGTAVPAAAAVVTTLEQLAPAAAVGVTAILAVGLAVGTLKLGMAGVNKAVKAAFNPGTKAADLKAALDKLAPPARAFVLELRSMKPEFTRLQLGTQGGLFAGLAAHVHDLGASVLPLLRTQLGQTATTLNIMAKGVIDTAAGLADGGVFGKALAGANKGLRNLVGVPGQVVNALGELAAAAAPSFARLTSAAAGGIAHLLDKLDTAFSNGGLEKAIDTAVTLAGQFGHVLGNIGTILGNVFAQVPPGSSGLIGFLGTLTAALAKATSMPQVQTALSDLFTVMAEIGKVAGPLLVKAFAVLGPVVTALAPPALRLIDALGDGLRPIIAALGPVLLAAAGAVGSLADAVSPLLPVVGTMIASLGPILTPVLMIVGRLFTALAPVVAQLGRSLLPPLAKITTTLGLAFAQMTPVLDTALSQLGSQGLLPIITGLGTVIGQLVSRYADQWLKMFQQLLPVIPLLIPVLIQLGQSLGQILTALAPLLPQITLLTVQLVSGLLPAIIPLIPVLVKLEVVFLRLVTSVITGVVIPVFRALTKAAGWIVTALTGVARVVGWTVQQIVKPFRWLYDVLLGHSIIPDIVNGIVKWFAGLPGRALSAIANLGPYLAGRARSAGSSLIGAVRGGLDGALGWIGGLPARARRALGDLSGVLYRSGKSLISGFVSGIESMAGSATSAAAGVLGKVKDYFPNSPAKTGPFSGRGWTHYSGLAVMDDWTGAMTSRTGRVVGAVSGVVGAAARAVPGRLPAPGFGVSPGAAAAAGGGTGPISITVPGVGGLVMAKEVQRALLELKRVAGVNIRLEIG